MNVENSVALQHYLESEVQRRNMPDPVTVADFLQLLWANTPVRPYADENYLRRIAQVAYERYAAQSVIEDIPLLTIISTPLNSQQIDDFLGNRRNYALVFGAESIFLQDTVHALAADSHYYGGVNVLGVHMDWILSDGLSVERAIAMDSDGIVKEFGFHRPIPIHIVQILHLPIKNERQLHRDLSTRFDKSIMQVNPFHSSKRADDKACTHSFWEQYKQEIASPKHILIPQGSSPEEIIERLKIFAENLELSELVVQPNNGTEGRGVEEFHIAIDLMPVVKHITDQVWPEGDAIIREKRGNVKYGNPPLNVTFRANVAWNGSEFIAESGYAQIAKDKNTFPASRGRGGAIVDINDALANLYYPDQGKWSRFIPKDEDIAAMKTSAVNAAYALNAELGEEDYLKYMGIDILLEVADAGMMISVLLEANPRPAGLSHSSEIVGISHRKPLLLVSREIFRYASGNSPPTKVHWKI